MTKNNGGIRIDTDVLQGVVVLIPQKANVWAVFLFQFHVEKGPLYIGNKSIFRKTEMKEKFHKVV